MKRVKRAQLGTYSGGIYDSDLRASADTYTPKTIEMHGFMEHVILNYSFFEINN